MLALPGAHPSPAKLLRVVAYGHTASDPKRWRQAHRLKIHAFSSLDDLGRMMTSRGVATIHDDQEPRGGGEWSFCAIMDGTVHALASSDLLWSASRVGAWHTPPSNHFFDATHGVKRCIQALKEENAIQNPSGIPDVSKVPVAETRAGITSSDGDSLTIRSADGSERVLNISPLLLLDENTGVSREETTEDTARRVCSLYEIGGRPCLRILDALKARRYEIETDSEP